MRICAECKKRGESWELVCQDCAAKSGESEAFILLTQTSKRYHAAQFVGGVLVAAGVAAGLFLFGRLLGLILPGLFGYAGEAIVTAFDLAVRVLILLASLLIIWFTIAGLREMWSGYGPLYGVSNARVEVSGFRITKIGKDATQFGADDQREPVSPYLRLQDVSSIDIFQSRVGCWFNYGDLKFNSEVKHPILVFQGIAEPLQFKLRTEEIIRDFAGSPAALALKPDTSFPDRGEPKHKKKRGPLLGVGGCGLLFAIVVGLLALIFYHGPDFRVETMRRGETRAIRGVLVVVVSDARKGDLNWTDSDTKNVRVEVRAPTQNLAEVNKSLNISANLISARVENVGPTVLNLDYVANVRVLEAAPDGRVQVHLWFMHPKLNPPWVLNQPVQRLTIAIKND